MSNDRNESEKKHAFTNYLFESNVKDFSWNASSTTHLSQKSLVSPLFDYTDIKFYYKESMVYLLDNLYQLEQRKNQDYKYKGPLALNDLILQKELNYIGPNKLTNYLKSKKHCNPKIFLQRYKLVIEFLAFCSLRLKKVPSSINDLNLYDKSLFMDFITEKKLANHKIIEFKKIFHLFFPYENITLYPVKKSEEFNHVLIRRHLDGISKHFNAGHEKKRIRNYIDFLTWLISSYSEFESYSINTIPVYLITKNHLVEYKQFLNRLVKEGIYKKHTVSDTFYIIRSLFASLYQMKLVSHDITTDVSGIKFEKYKYRDIPTNKQLSEFFNAVMIYTPDPIKFNMAYKLMLYLGLRSNEVVSLETTNINLSTQSIACRGKGGKYDILHLPKALIEDLTSLTNQKGKYVFSDKPIIFQDELYQYYKLISFVLDWNFPGGVHIFRHTFITSLSLYPNLPPQVIQALSRHVRTDTTSLYIHRNDNSLTNAINNLNYT